jgi:hypothetical protein
MTLFIVLTYCVANLCYTVELPTTSCGGAQTIVEASTWLYAAHPTATVQDVRCAVGESL